MSEPRRSTRTRAREEAAAPLAPDPPKETPVKTPAKSSLKRKRTATLTTKDSTPATPAPDTASQGPAYVLPSKLTDGQPLPTLPEPQVLDLSANEYQSIQQSGVLAASLQQSRAVWISGSNSRLFHANFIPPKKVADRTEEDKQAMQRQKEITRNFPQLGGGVEAQLVIEPHTFSIRLYGPREVIRATQKKQPMYGQWPNHNQYAPYQQYNNTSPTPYAKPTPPPPRPSQPKPPPPQKAPPLPKPAPPSTPAPDPVIHMLAQRAGVDPELKAVMKIVAEGKATKEQLEFFQGHINELTSILAKQKEAAAKAAPQPQPPPPPATSQPPPPRPATQPVVQPVVQPTQQNTSKPYTPAPPPAPQSQPAPPPPPQASYNTSYNNAYSQPQHHASPYGGPSQPSQPPLPPYRPLVFDFVEGNGDKFYFPSYSFSEWLPGNQGAKFSFLITKLNTKSKSKPKEIASSTPVPKSGPLSTPVSAPVPTPSVTPNPPGTVNQDSKVSTPAHGQAQIPAPGTPVPTQYVPPPRIEEFDERKDIKDIDFYQPVTFVLLTTNYEILQSLPRAIRHPDVVEKYMNEVFDVSRRADETYLAFRLPKEGVADGDSEAKYTKDATPTVSTPITDVMMGGTSAVAEKKKSAGRPKKSLV